MSHDIIITQYHVGMDKKSVTYNAIGQIKPKKKVTWWYKKEINEENHLCLLFLPITKPTRERERERTILKE